MYADSRLGKSFITMPTRPESERYENFQSAKAQSSAWFKVGIVATASLLVGGLAAAWWYRKTLHKLREAAGNSHDPQFGMSGDAPEDES